MFAPELGGREFEGSEYVFNLQCGIQRNLKGLMW